jgi:hypothetical protein
MSRLVCLLYADIACAIFFATLRYLIAFVGALLAVPRTVDVGGPAAIPTLAALIDLAPINHF